jgi:purine catabolism regulator
MLRSFVSHHGSILKVAHELDVHRNTVRNRLAGIEALLGRSLDDPQTRFSVWMALQVLPESGGSAVGPPGPADGGR